MELKQVWGLKFLYGYLDFCIRKGAEKHLNRIKAYIPDTGTVRIMRLTEKQFCNCGLYQAEEDFQESIVGVNDFISL